MEKLLEQVTAVVRQAGEKLLDGYAVPARPATKVVATAPGVHKELLALLQAGEVR